ncbi:UNVERIFIED_CONTAM: hypothetical protein PYX00_008516 [Menopon gallinae]|uniref:Uncharacterized protein n=1 Tax=Menopon gallinae TaxID=328185 RepID=A0AAW2HNJ0_9NEOP
MHCTRPASGGNAREKLQYTRRGLYIRGGRVNPPCSTLRTTVNLSVGLHFTKSNPMGCSRSSQTDDT